MSDPNPTDPARAELPDAEVNRRLFIALGWVNQFKAIPGMRGVKGFYWEHVVSGEKMHDIPDYCSPSAPHSLTAGLVRKVVEAEKWWGFLSQTPLKPDLVKDGNALSHIGFEAGKRGEPEAALEEALIFCALTATPRQIALAALAALEGAGAGTAGGEGEK